MAIPTRPIKITTPPKDIPLAHVELLETGRITALHQFLRFHTDLTEEEYANLTIGDVRQFTEQVMEELNNQTIPLASKPS